MIAVSPNLESPHMSANEMALLVRELRKSTAYLEFGMGGSTLLAVREKVAQIVTVDSDPAWVGCVRSHVEIAPRVADGSLLALHADISPVREYGNPLDRSCLDKWRHYLSEPWKAWARLGRLPDLVLVDGRFRVACCASIALACAGTPAGNGVRVLLHDVNEERPHYLDVLEHFEVVESVESMVLMGIRDDFRQTSGLSRLLDRQYDFG